MRVYLDKHIKCEVFEFLKTTSCYEDILYLRDALTLRIDESIF